MSILSAPTPILRIFDEAKAREFYLDWLGFGIDWEHRFEAKAPLYLQVSRDGCRLHLSEHHGDCSPGARLRVPVGDVACLHGELIAKNYAFSRPGLDTPPWGGQEFTVPDPFGNRLTFHSSRD